MSSPDFDVFDQLAQYENNSPTVIQTNNSNTLCPHTNTVMNCGVVECLDCGEQLKNSLATESEGKMMVSIDNRSACDGNRCWAPKKKGRGIRDDVQGLGFPEPVVSKAEEIFQNVTEGAIFRVDKRKSIIVACLMEAYKILKIPITLETLLQRLPTENVTVGTRIVETRIKKYDTNRTRVTYHSPEDSIRDILARWESDPRTVDEVIQLFRQVDDKSSLLNRSRVESVAAGIVYYYALATKRNNITLKDFSTQVQLSESTIQKIAREVSAVLGTREVLSY